MLRASSEIAVATSVASVAEKPISSARLRPWRRAFTISMSDVTGTELSILKSDTSRAMLLEFPIQIFQSFFEIERGRNLAESDTQLHHRKRNLRLYPHDHRLRAAEPDHMGDIPQGAGSEGIQHIQRRHVDNDAARAVTPDTGDQRVAQLHQIGVR